MKNTIEYQRLSASAASICAKTDFVPEIGVVFGSGLSGLFDGVIEVAATIPYSEIVNFPTATVSGHRGRLILGNISGKKVAVLEGRCHCYEGYSAQQVVAPIRTLGLLGVKKLILTNAAGGVNKQFFPGDLMLISDQISTFVQSPLTGENIDELGVRFPDMGAVYDVRVKQAVMSAADKLNIPLQTGTYIQVNGPQYETPKEVKMLSSFGADAVGMSTAVEAIAARHMGMRVGGISCITNFAGIGEHGGELSHEEIKQAVAKVEKDLQALLIETIKNI